MARRQGLFVNCTNCCEPVTLRVPGLCYVLSEFMRVFR